MSTSPRKVTLAPDVVLQVIDGEALLLKLDQEVVFALNDTGARIAQLIADGREPQEIVDMLSLEYGVSPDGMARDVESLVRSLESRGLVCIDDEATAE